MSDDFCEFTAYCLIGIAIVMILAFISIIGSSYDDQVFHDDYCANVEMWELDTDAGIEPRDRAGHPNYKGVTCGE